MNWLRMARRFARGGTGRLALTVLARVEGGGELPRRDEMKALLGAGAEGNALDRALEVSC